MCRRPNNGRSEHEQLEVALLYKAVKKLCAIEERLDEILEHIEECRECLEEGSQEEHEMEPCGPCHEDEEENEAPCNSCVCE